MKLYRIGKVEKTLGVHRVTRFGFGYLEGFFSSHGVGIEVVFGEEPKDLRQELI